jgi:hypothetical protein
MSELPLMRVVSQVAVVTSVLTGLAIVVGWLLSSSFYAVAKVAVPVAGGVLILVAFSAAAYGLFAPVWGALTRF